VRRAALLPLLMLVAVIAGCGSEEESTPVACLNGPQAFATALEQAPGAVRLAGGVTISDCLIENQSGGDLSNVGAALVRSATQLNAEARRDPGGAAALRLGYLIGAVQRGADDTAGIHAELARRLEAAARFSPGGVSLPSAFEQAYEKGYAAGRNDG
jgi:hypothetical protein